MADGATPASPHHTSGDAPPLAGLLAHIEDHVAPAEVILAAARAAVAVEGVNEGYIDSTARDEVFIAGCNAVWRAAVDAARAAQDAEIQRLQAQVAAVRADAARWAAITPDVHEDPELRAARRARRDAGEVILRLLDTTDTDHG